MSKSVVLGLTVLAAIAARPVAAQEPGPREWAFGFSGVSYLIEASDGVFTDPDEHRTGNFGFRVTKASFGDRSWGWLIDAELYLGVANRILIDVDMPNTIFGLQAFAGPVVALGPVQAYAAVGVNRTTVGESKIVEVPISVVSSHIGTGGVSELWLVRLNAGIQAAGGGDVIASIPRYAEVSPAGMFGLGIDFGPMFRLSLDYLPIFMGPTRHNLRATFSLAG